MLGAVIGDIAGSRFEWNNLKSKEFTLLDPSCRTTDDSVMTLAVAQAVLDCRGDYRLLGDYAVKEMRGVGRHYPSCGYGGRFFRWLSADDPRPYHSFGNGAAMRVSACGYAAGTLEETLALAEKVTAVTHDHPEGLRGAKAAAAAVFLARTGKTKAEIRRYIEGRYYPLDFTLDGIRADYVFDVTCQGSVPQAIEAFLESKDYEDAIRGAISVGGDSDTLAAIAGGIAEAYYGIPPALREKALAFLDGRLRKILDDFEAKFPPPPERVRAD